MRIDAHQHFWRYAPELYGWMSEEMRVIRRDFLPDDLSQHLAEHDIDASVWTHTVYLYREDWGTLTPLLLSIVRNDETPVESRTVSYTVTFNVPVAGVDPTDFALGGTPVLYVPNAPAAPLGSITPTRHAGAPPSDDTARRPPSAVAASAAAAATRSLVGW